MNKLNFIPNPTFSFDLLVEVPGQDNPSKLKMTFNHLTPKKWNEIYAETQVKMNEANDNDEQLKVMAEAVKQLATGWEWEHEFNDENIVATLQNYPSFYAGMIRQYGEELWGVRAKN